MATFLRTTIKKSIGIEPVTVLYTGANNTMTVIGFNIANITPMMVTIDIKVVDNTPLTGYYLKGIEIPPNTNLKVITNGEKLVLGNSCSVVVNSNMQDAVDVVISYAELL